MYAKQGKYIPCHAVGEVDVLNYLNPRLHVFMCSCVDDTIILKSPYLVSEGGRVVLHCQFWNGNQRMATFFKDGLEVATRSSAHPEAVIGMAVENVTKAQEGFYKCASQDRTLESPESWLSVKCTGCHFSLYVILQNTKAMT